MVVVKGNILAGMNVAIPQRMPFRFSIVWRTGPADEEIV
jgi:hypothetical protein